MSDEWVLLKQCASMQEAVVLRSVLEGAGVECVLPDEHTLGVHPGMAYLDAGVRMLVRAEDFERAEEILEESEPG
jgi:hypothetical protein